MKKQPGQPTTSTPASNRSLGTGVALLHPPGFARELLHQTVEDRLGLTITIRADSFAAFLAACRTTPPQAAIIDDRTIEESWDNCLSQLAEVCPDLPILVLGNGVNRIPIRRALDAGAQSYVDRFCPLDTLLQAIRTTSSGKEFLCARSRELLRGNSNGSDKPSRGKDLSRREIEVLRAIAEGKMTKQIAQEHGRSIYTIENQRRRILRKTGFSSVAQMTLLALDMGLVRRHSHCS